MHFIPRIAVSIPPLHMAIDAAARRRGAAGMDGVDWNRIYWTPPLSPRQAYDLEAGQIQTLGLEPLVSLTDHDDISAPVHLNAIPELAGRVPISVEWTFPFAGTFFHVGIHNLPPVQAHELWTHMEAATQSENQAILLERLQDVAHLDGTLIVLNHPLWDEKGVGGAKHRMALSALLRKAAQWIDALEWNGFRPRAENEQVLALGIEADLPVVAGGDRHGLEPNSCLNVTGSAEFPDFAAEIRRERRSEMLLLPHHFECGTMRVVHHLWEILRDDPSHGLGWRRWDERMFFRDKQGVTRSLRAHWGNRPPSIVWLFVNLVHLMKHEPARYALRAAASLREESGS